LLIGNNHATSLFRGEGFNLPAEVSPYRQTWQDSFLASQLGRGGNRASSFSAAQSLKEKSYRDCDAADVDFLNRETAAFLDLVTDRGKKLD